MYQEILIDIHYNIYYYIIIFIARLCIFTYLYLLLANQL